MHVLIVDDAPERLEGLMVAFMQQGWLTTGCANTHVARACLTNTHVDAVLLANRHDPVQAGSLADLARREQGHALRIVLGERGQRGVPAQIHRLIRHDTPVEDICRHTLRAHKALNARAPRLVAVQGDSPVFASVRKVPLPVTAPASPVVQ